MRVFVNLEERSRKLDQTEIFIEAPYRNDALFQAIVANCRPETLLSLAIDLTSATEEIRTQGIGEWRGVRPAGTSQATDGIPAPGR